MSNFEASSTSSHVGNTRDVSTLSSTPNFPDFGPSRSSFDLFDLLIKVMKDILTAITNKGLDDKMIEKRMKLRDTLEPIATDFSNLFEAISQGAEIFSDKKAFTNNLSSEAQSVASDVLKGVGNAHWAAVGLLAIAKVLERLDKISTNDRDCIDLLKGMLDLAKLIRLLKHTNADLHTEILEKMSEAVHLIVSGAILCNSFITCNKFSKFLLAKKILEELMYLRRKMDGMKSDMCLQMNIMIVSTITIHLPRQQQHDGSHRLQQQHSDDADEVAEICETEISTVEAETEIEDLNGIDNQGNLMDISYKNNQHQLLTYKRRTFLSFGRHLIKYTVRQIKKPVHTVFGKSLRQRQPSSEFFSMRAEHEVFSSLANAYGFEWLPIRFTIDEIKLATNCFRDRLGQGGFASIYRGILSDGRQVAVKKSRETETTGLMTETTQTTRLTTETTGLLMRELEFMVNLRHRNILKLVGYCITGDDEVMLVYDYMPIGTVDDLLFDPLRSHVLDWSTRLKIILGVIEAVDYLHQGLDACIVHRDIKPSNVLLDDNFNAKLYDFGISKSIARSLEKSILDIHEVEKYCFSAFSDTIETSVRGTIGYIAPEYALKGNLRIKTDIYSLGIFLLNMVSAKKAYDFSRLEEDGDVHLIYMAWRLQQEDDLIKLVDPSLEDVNINWESILRSIYTAFWCTQIDPDLRPSASQALSMLLTKEEIPLPPQIRIYTRDNSYQSSSTESTGNSIF